MGNPEEGECSAQIAQKKKDPKRKQKREALKIAHDIRKFEIDLYELVST